MRNLLVFLIFVIALFAVACSDDATEVTDAGTDAVPVDAAVDAPMEGPTVTEEAGPEEAGPADSAPEATLEDAEVKEAAAGDGATGD